MRKFGSASIKSPKGRICVRIAWFASLCVSLTPGCLLAQGWELGAPVKIRLTEHVQVSDPLVRLGDIASLTTYDLASMRRLMTLTVGRVPRTGQSVVLDREVLAKWIRVQAGLLDSQIQWQGANSMEVSVRTRDISGEEIARVAEKALKMQLANQQPPGARIEIQATTMPRDLLVTETSIGLKARTASFNAISPRMTVWVDVLVSGRPVQAMPVGFDVAVYAPVAVVTQDLPSGAALVPQAMVVREKNIAGLTTPALLDTLQSQSQSQLHERRVRRPMRAGDVVTMANTETTPAVARGSWASLDSHQVGVNVQSRVEVLQDGYTGQTILIKSRHSRTPLMARVAGPGRLEIAQ
jgi:flagellar basal body P-ring formation protein FlgA